MLREMSIDHITGSGTGEGPNQEDFDEDFEEEDTLHDPTIDNLDNLDDTDDEDDEEDLDESDTEEDVIHEEFAETGEVTPNGIDQPQVGSKTIVAGSPRWPS